MKLFAPESGMKARLHMLAEMLSIFTKPIEFPATVSDQLADLTSRNILFQDWFCYENLLYYLFVL